MRLKSAEKGYTLIEILVVVALLAILAIAAFSGWQAQLKKARDAQRKTDLSKIQTALREYYEDNGVFPSTDSMVCGGDGLEGYLDKLPCDPVNAGEYIYDYISDSPRQYVIYTNLEYTGDKVITDLGCVSGCGPSDANYYVSSDNVDVGSVGGEEGVLPTCPSNNAPVDERYCFENVCNTCCPPGGYRCSRGGTRCLYDGSCKPPVPTSTPTPTP